MEIRGEVDRSWEYSHEILTFGLAVELLPPLTKILELRIIGDQNLNLLSELGINFSWRRT